MVGIPRGRDGIRAHLAAHARRGAEWTSDRRGSLRLPRRAGVGGARGGRRALAATTRSRADYGTVVRASAGARRSDVAANRRLAELGNALATSPRRGSEFLHREIGRAHV